jgi:putative flippase GtrA
MTSGTHSRFARFVLVGGTATAFHYTVAAALTLSGLSTVVTGSTIGFVLSAVLNYALNARFTFGTTAANAGQGLRFFVTVATGCLLNAAILKGAIALGLHAVPAQLLATALVLAWNFALSSVWVFRPAAAPRPITHPPEP